METIIELRTQIETYIKRHEWVLDEWEYYHSDEYMIVCEPLSKMYQQLSDVEEAYASKQIEELLPTLTAFQQLKIVKENVEWQDLMERLHLPNYHSMPLLERIIQVRDELLHRQSMRNAKKRVGRKLRK